MKKDINVSVHFGEWTGSSRGRELEIRDTKSGRMLLTAEFTMEEFGRVLGAGEVQVPAVFRENPCLGLQHEVFSVLISFEMGVYSTRDDRLALALHTLDSRAREFFHPTAKVHVEEYNSHHHVKGLYRTAIHVYLEEGEEMPTIDETMTVMLGVAE